MTMIIIANKSPLVVDEQGGQGTQEVIVVKDEDAETNLMATPFIEETQGDEERTHDGEVPEQGNQQVNLSVQNTTPPPAADNPIDEESRPVNLVDTTMSLVEENKEGKFHIPTLVAS